MQGIWITRPGGSEVLDVRETPDPTPKAGEVRVRAEFCGLNFAEISARQGLYPDAPKPPCIVGYEGAGVIDQLGPGCEGSGLAEGQRVVYLTRFGGHASHVCVPASQALIMPESMSFDHAAALPVNYLTAYHMLFNIKRIRPGEHVLIHMAAGGVGTASLQLCQTVDDITTYGTASAKKHDYIRKHGCDHPIDYRTKDYVEEVKRITDGRGVDLVLDALGAADWSKGYSLLKPGGTLAAFGLANSNTGGKRNLLHVLGQLVRIPRYTPMKLMDDNRAIAGINVGHLWEEQELLRDCMQELIALYELEKIRPHIGGIFPFSKAADAFGEIEYGRNVGKILLKPDD